MTHPFCPGYGKAPWKKLVENYPGEEAYPAKRFRVEWGPIFHRGRLDGTARVLVIGQDPAAHESIARRILVGEAGQRVQGFLARLGIERSYVFVNTYLYSVYGSGGSPTAPLVTEYRNRWLDAIADRNDLEAVVALGTAAKEAYDAWPASAGATWSFANMTHPTFPESASSSGAMTKAAAFAKLTASWNAALDTIAAKPLTADVAVGPPVKYGAALTPADDAPIPEFDLPAGLPPWMRDLAAWAHRSGKTAAEKRANITVTIPKGAMPVVTP